MGQRMTEQFWSTWSLDYLYQLNQHIKWPIRQPSVKIGDIVLVKHKQFRSPNGCWLNSKGFTQLILVSFVFPLSELEGQYSIGQFSSWRYFHLNILKLPWRTSSHKSNVSLVSTRRAECFGNILYIFYLSLFVWIAQGIPTQEWISTDQFVKRIIIIVFSVQFNKTNFTLIHQRVF